MGKAAKFLLLLAGRLKVLGLLDEYSGAAAAYSLRSLSSATTNVVKVRRSGDDAELDFSASQVSDGTLAAWVVAGGGTEDGFVTTWYDQSGNTNNATQATAANQPKIVSSGTLVTENGKAALDFDGVNDFIETALVNFGSVVTMFIAAQSTSSTDDYYFDGQSANNRFGLYSSSSNTVYQTFSTSSTGTVNTITLGTKSTAGSNNLLYLLKNSTSSELAENGGSATTGTLTSDDFIGITIGARFNGAESYADRFREFIIYSSDQSANRTGIEDNINDYYNIYP